MKTLSTSLQAHLEGTTTLAWCWRIARADGVTFGFTDHDRTLTFDGTDFEPESGLTASEVRSGSDLSVDAQGALLRQVCATVQQTEPRAGIECTITAQYRNMRYWLEKDMTAVELARRACRKAGLEPFSIPIRGGTDGSRLTEKGVPTPNVFTGMAKIHGRLEWVSVQDMASATQVCLALA